MPIFMPERMPDRISEYMSDKMSLGGGSLEESNLVVTWRWLWVEAKLCEHSLLSVLQAAENAGSSTLSVPAQLRQNRMQNVCNMQSESGVNKFN